MRRLQFSKDKTRQLFEAYRNKTGLSFSKISLKLNMGATYLSSVLAANREHLPSDGMVHAMAKLLKVDVDRLCEATASDEKAITKNDVLPDDSDDVIVVLKSSTLEAFRTALVNAEKRDLEVLPAVKSQQVKELLEKALSLL